MGDQLGHRPPLERATVGQDLLLELVNAVESLVGLLHLALEPIVVFSLWGLKISVALASGEIVGRRALSFFEHLSFLNQHDKSGI